ncbi:MAG: hypothetical protein EA405_13590 [Rhodospirillales bacterium]|nr:MAG: hypothetical protein EA405_13590 [Rhodospirillales bacterium]
MTSFEIRNWQNHKIETFVAVNDEEAIQHAGAARARLDLGKVTLVDTAAGRGLDITRYGAARDWHDARPSTAAAAAEAYREAAESEEDFDRNF